MRRWHQSTSLVYHTVFIADMRKFCLTLIAKNNCKAIYSIPYVSISVVKLSIQDFIVVMFSNSCQLARWKYPDKLINPCRTRVVTKVFLGGLLLHS